MFTCQLCNKQANTKQFKYKPYQYIEDHIPQTLTVCRECVYKESFGTKRYRKKMKEKALEDGNNR